MGAVEHWRVTWLEHDAVPLVIVVDAADALVYVGFWHDTDTRVADLNAFADRHGAVTHDDPRAETAATTQLGEYLAGRRESFSLPLRLLGTEFQRQTWQALLDIPFGHVHRYGQQARTIGRPGAAQAVGHANGQNPIAVVVPCHRVVGADGSLTGFGGGLETKRWLLQLERRRVPPPWIPKAGPRRPESAAVDQLGLFAT